MRKLLLILSSMLCFACNLDYSDDRKSFQLVDYSSFVTDDSYVISDNSTAVKIFNCFYSEFGLGTFDCSGIYTITQSAILNGKDYSDTLKKDIKQINISQTLKNISTLCEVTFITTDNEKLTYCYEWQYVNTNYWKNDIFHGSLIIFK